jgi:hypothetical protein
MEWGSPWNLIWLILGQTVMYFFKLPFGLAVVTHDGINRLSGVTVRLNFAQLV